MEHLKEINHCIEVLKAVKENKPLQYFNSSYGWVEREFDYYSFLLYPNGWRVIYDNEC